MKITANEESVQNFQGGNDTIKKVISLTFAKSIFVNTTLRFSNVVLLLLFLASCAPIAEESPFAGLVSEIRTTYAPDKRVALFDVRLTKSKDSYILRGESNLADAIDALKQELAAKNVSFIDSIQLLPSAELKGKTVAVVNVSAANLRSNPKQSAELASQATLGTPIQVLKKQGGWYYVQTPDDYLSWVNGGDLQLMDTDHHSKWKAAPKIIYLETYGHAYTDTGETAVVSDLVAGCILEALAEENNHCKVQFPDGREGFAIKDEAKDYQQWLDRLDPTVDDLLATSKSLMGVPYLWGGTSTKGVDCSGFMKTIYFLNGMVIPRDASQQVHTGKPVDSVGDFSKLRKGDLLFFGTKATDSSTEKVVHVAMWIGDNEFIHASDMVEVNSMDPNAHNFDESNKNRYLRSKRILKEEDHELIHLTRTPLFKD